MVLFLDLKITSSAICGAVAEAVLHDLRVNSLGLNGFPEITVMRSNGGGFKISLQFGGHKQGFELSDCEAANAVQRMKATNGHDPEIFDRIQEALAQLEGAVSNSR